MNDPERFLIEGYSPEGYANLGRRGIYYVDVHEGSSKESRKYVGIGPKRYPDIQLVPSEALALLAWLISHKDELEQLAKEKNA